ncbi:MAG: preprotein translocase subunit SecG [Rhodospirillaceae bacterium]|nr:preprotein translocase subunit SecG [Rhodospirillaceae bacterium]
METVIIVIHLMVIIALVAVVLMQRSEGGALGIGGDANFMSARGQGNVLTRSTAILAAAFFATSIALTVLARIQERPSDILDTVPTATDTTKPGTGGEGILDTLKGMSQPQGPATDGAVPGVPDASAPVIPDTSGAAPASPDASAATPAPAEPATPAAPAAPAIPTTQ